jgi:hypothetical protein
VASVADVVWGIGVEPKHLTDRTQMCFYIIPRQGGSGGMIAGGKQEAPRQPKGRRGKVPRQTKEGSNEN